MKLLDRPHGRQASVRNHKLHDISIDTAEELQRRDVVTQGIPYYIARRDEFLVDNSINTNVLRDIDVVDVFNQGNGLFHTVSLCLQACQNVGLGVFGHCDESIDTLDALFLKHIHVASVGIDHQGV